MKPTTLSFESSLNIGLTKCRRPKAIGSKSPSWLPVAVGAFCIWVASLCQAQIEVDAYVTDPLSGKVFVINTATNMSICSPILVGSRPVAVTVSPDGSDAYVRYNGIKTISVIDT